MLPLFDGDDLTRVLDTPSLVAALSRAFERPAESPPRTQLALADGRVILMPAWRNDGHFGIKISTVYPNNPGVGLPAVGGTYCLLRARDGVPVAVMDGRILTLLRTAAASALAASHLARRDASVLLMVGAGALAPYLVEAHRHLRPIREVLCWNRNRDKAESLAVRLADRGHPARAVTELGSAARTAHIISTATFSRQALIHGEDLRPGVHLDLVGAFTPDMRECDADTVARSRVFVDTYEGAHEEAGDLLLAEQEGRFAMQDVEGDLHALVTGRVPGRRSADEITLFKSVGSAIEDLAAAELAAERLGGFPR